MNITTTITTPTYTFDSVTGTYTEGEPTVDVVKTVRPVEGEDCPVVVPPIDEPPVVVPPVTTTPSPTPTAVAQNTPLAATGGADMTPFWWIGGIALAAGLIASATPRVAAKIKK